MPSRRTVLSVGACSFASVLGGCSSLSGFGSSSSSCPLSHEVALAESYRATDPKHVTYDELSEQGKEAFVAAVEEDGYRMEYDGSNAPADFSYSDEMTEYRLEYENETYILLTYTNEGCTVT